MSVLLWILLNFFSVFFSVSLCLFLLNDFFFNYYGKGQIFSVLLLLHVISILFLCFQVSLFNFVFLIAWALALPYAQFRPLASSICTVWTCVIIVCKMLYQLTSIEPSTFSSNCTLVSTSAYSKGLTAAFFSEEEQKEAYHVLKPAVHLMCYCWLPLPPQAALNSFFDELLRFLFSQERTKLRWI